MKIKLIVMGSDRHNKVYKVKNNKVESNTVKVGPKSARETYFLDADRFQITWEKVLFFFKRHYATYYYRQGTPQPLPVPDFEDIEQIGIESEELAAIFNPWFYRIIASPTVPAWQQIQFYVMIGLAVGMLYVGYQNIQLMEAVQELTRLMGGVPNGG